MRALTRSASTTAMLALAVLTLVLCVLALRPRTAPEPDSTTGNNTAQTSSGTAASPTTQSSAQTRTIAVYGDQVSTGGGTIDSPGSLEPRSWLSHLDGTGFRYVGGSAERNATAEQAASTARAVPADFQVAFLGISDAYAGRSVEDTVTSLSQLQRKVAPDAPSSFVVVALGPSRGLSAPALRAWNATLKSSAATNKWT